MLHYLYYYQRRPLCPELLNMTIASMPPTNNIKPYGSIPHAPSPSLISYHPSTKPSDSNSIVFTTRTIHSNLPGKLMSSKNLIYSCYNSEGILETHRKYQGVKIKIGVLPSEIVHHATIPSFKPMAKKRKLSIAYVPKIKEYWNYNTISMEIDPVFMPTKSSFPQKINKRKTISIRSQICSSPTALALICQDHKILILAQAPILNILKNHIIQ